MLNIKKLLTQMLTPEHYTNYTLPSTVAMGFDIYRVGPVVSINISNPTKMAAQNNAILTLPEGWRPISPLGASFMLNAPTSSGVSSQTLRMTINTAGALNIYNYSSAISGNTNINQTCTYIAGN